MNGYLRVRQFGTRSIRCTDVFVSLWGQGMAGNQRHVSAPSCFRVFRIGRTRGTKRGGCMSGGHVYSNRTDSYRIAAVSSLDVYTPAVDIGR